MTAVHNLLAVTLAVAATACTGPATAPGARGRTAPRSEKPESYDKRDIPRTPMRSHHVLEQKDDCGRNCDFLQTAESAVTLHLQDNGVATASDEGELIERLKSAAGATVTETTWKRAWSGSWSEGENALDVVLKPEEVSCSRKMPDGTVDSSCAKPTGVRLRCRMARLDIVRPKNRSAKAWACRARGVRRAEAITSGPWVFGIADALIVLEGGTAHEPTRRYALEKRAPDDVAKK